ARARNRHLSSAAPNLLLSVALSILTVTSGFAARNRQFPCRNARLAVGADQFALVACMDSAADIGDRRRPFTHEAFDGQLLNGTRMRGRFACALCVAVRLVHRF